MTQPPFSPEQLPAVEEVAIPESLPILGLPDAVMFPGAVLPLSISGENVVRLIDEAALSTRVIGVFWETSGDAGADPLGLARTGCAAQIARLARQPGGGVQVLLQGLARVQILQLQTGASYPQARVTVLDEPEPEPPEAAALARTVRVAFEQVVRLSPNLPDQAAVVAANIPRAGTLADLIAANLGLSAGDQQAVLDALDLAERLRLVLGLLERERELLDIANRTREDVAKSQREYVLRQQLETIRRELGEGDEQGAEVAELRRRLEEAGLPDEARREAERELERLARMSPAAPDYNISRTYLDWLIGLPWNVSTPDNLDLARARAVLDEDHYDLEKIKDRIVEYLAVRKLHAEQGNARARSPILCFLGPPGVGKTSLGQSVARALERKFVRVALGGVRDEADIRGFRRTYIGAIPGRILQGLNRAGSNNPVMLLDEIDKLAAGIQGDPAAALLELLDPAQNNTFVDRYLDVPFDMSQVLFICTANQLETIPGPLLDRMELISLAGYTELEKLQIARRYLIPRQIEANGLAPASGARGADRSLPAADAAPGPEAEGAGAPVSGGETPASNLPPAGLAERSPAPELSDEALRRLVREYTLEAGVRDLERRIGAGYRKMATRLASGLPLPAQIGGPDLDELLGPPRFRSERILGEDEVGVATGLAWTPAGGDVLMVEASAVPGSGQLILTGHLGDVMRESARAAVTYARSRDGALGIPADEFQRRDIHIHVPAGAVPKDGPSAGITMASAIISALTGRPAAKRVAMTGEITLRGRVLPIGGLKEKLLAAQRAGVRTVLIPHDNEVDLRDVPEETRGQLEIVPVEHMDEVVARVLLPAAGSPDGAGGTAPSGA
ncbi:MAG TPA: LON peptidase substrate-binding domain-containing protein [Chloroflexaceae bacterium]|nr:LON peptidase substrate-binding domain-containing protein [Chloroflexaceae bacterium]